LVARRRVKGFGGENACAFAEGLLRKLLTCINRKIFKEPKRRRKDLRKGRVEREGVRDVA